MPDGAGFCPNCGVAVKKRRDASVSSWKSVANSLKIGVLGAFLSVAISMFSPIPLIPSFIASLIVIYFSKAGEIEDAMIIALTVYVLTEAITSGMVLGSLYINGESFASLYGDYVPTLEDVIMYVVSPVTPFIAGYIGAKIAPKKREKPDLFNPY